MGIINEPVLVVTNRRVGGMYRNMGYEPFDVTDKTCKVWVNAEDVFKNARVPIRVSCDYCGEIHVVSKHLYTADIKMSQTKKWACKKCMNKKTMETCTNKYGCHFTQLESYKEKMRQANLEKFGVEHPWKLKEVQQWRRRCFVEKYGVENPGQIESGKKKAIQTNLERYGVTHSSKLKETQDKKRATVVARYGVEHVVQLQSVKDKFKKTCQERYGVDAPMQLSEFRQKANETFYKNGSGVCSSQQRHIWEVIGGELNYPACGYSLDILIGNVDIEYNGSGHDLCVLTGQKTREEFDKKERMRKGCLKKNGYKILNLDSHTDRLPPDDIIKYIVDSLIFFLNSFDDREVSINLDTFEITTSA